MPRRRHDPDDIGKFGEVLERTLKTKDIKKSELASISGLTPQTISEMIAGNSDRLTRPNVLKCLVGLIRKHAITEKDDANYLLELASEDISISFEQLSRANKRDQEILELLEERKKELTSERKKEAIIKRRYHTRDRMPLVGREKNLQEIMSLLQDRRLLTLVGAPGVGKTELAWQIKELTQEQGIQTSFLDLELDTKAAVILGKINNVLQNIDRQMQMLLILDNCEQIEKQEITEVMRGIEEFISKYEQISMLLTSRIKFNDNNYYVLPLDVPIPTNEPSETLKNYGGVRLFLERGKITDHDLIKYAQQIAVICITLDGLPLAINMIASWVEQLGIDAIYKGLMYNQPTDPTINKTSIQKLEYDNFAMNTNHHRSLDEVIKWSYELLENDERMLFRWLSVFPCECHLDSVISICAMSNFSGQDTPINILKTLSNHSLINFKSQEIAMHNTLRSYGRHQMDDIVVRVTNVLQFELLSVPPALKRMVIVKLLPKEEPIIVSEASYLRQLLMILIKIKEFSWFIDNCYSREKLEKAAEYKNFLDEPTEDIDITKQLRSILYHLTDDDIFYLRGENKYKSSLFIEKVIKEYKIRKKEPLSGKEARKAFLDAFDEIYPPMFLDMLLKEITPTLLRLAAEAQNPPWNGEIWPVFGLHIGLLRIIVTIIHNATL